MKYWRVALVLPPTPQYKYDRNKWLGVVAENLQEAFEKTAKANPDCVIQSINCGGVIDIQ